MKLWNDHNLKLCNELTEKYNCLEKAKKHILKLSQATERCFVSVVITDNNGNIEYTNQQFTKNTGYSFEDVVGKNPRILKSGVQPYNFYARLWHTIAAGFEWKGRLCNKKKNGELYWEYQSISPIKDENDNIINFVVFGIDDTEHIKAEKEACKRENLLSKMLEISEEAIISTNEKQQIIFFNLVAEHIFGYKADEVIGRHVDILIPERLRSIYNKILDSFAVSDINIKHLSKIDDQLFCIKRDGGEFPVEGSVAKLKEDSRTIFTIALRDITDQKKLQEKALKGEKAEERVKELYKLAIYDGLTGLFNKRHFVEMSEYVLNSAARHKEKACAIMLDIDHFKSVNDTYGHIVGDEVLKSAATIMKKNLRKTDIIGRYGGEEFSILLNKSNQNGAYIVAEKLRKDIENNIFNTNKGSLKITISLGISEFNSQKHKGLSELLQTADVALYTAKNSGRNQTSSYTPILQTSTF